MANGLNVREAAARIKVSKTALYAALKASQPDAPDHPCNRLLTLRAAAF